MDTKPLFLPKVENKYGLFFEASILFTHSKAIIMKNWNQVNQKRQKNIVDGDVLDV